jgi:hypothetical protein
MTPPNTSAPGDPTPILPIGDPPSDDVDNVQARCVVFDARIISHVLDEPDGLFLRKYVCPGHPERRVVPSMTERSLVYIYIYVIASLTPEQFSVLEVIGHERHDLVVGNPLIFLSNPLGLRCFAPIAPCREPVEVPEALGCPSQVEHSPQDVSLDLRQFEVRCLRCIR